jgi:glycine/D-amino acid oxidase-like deaminating enzyme
MEKIGVIGAGPIGLAVADVISNAGHTVNIFDVGKKGRATYRAAAAFWTPFSSGVDDISAANQSQRTLDHFKRQANRPDNDSNTSGIEERDLEMHFLKGTFGRRPEWSLIPELHTQFANLRARFKTYRFDDDHNLVQAGFPTTCETRCEMTYKTPVICVDKYMPFAKTQLEARGCSIIAVDHLLEFGTVASTSFWSDLFRKHGVSKIVFCLGAETIAAKFPLESFGNLNSFSPKKGIVAHIHQVPVKEDRVILFEGGIFDTETLYLVPAVDRFVLGGIVHTVGKPLTESDWTALPSEKQDVLSRAMTFLPKKYQDLITKELGTPTHLNVKADWRAGVRPVFAGGPLIGKFNEKLLGCPAFYCFGHGGSGFTFCYDSANTLLEDLIN